MFAKVTYMARRRRLAHDVGSGLLLFSLARETAFSRA